VLTIASHKTVEMSRIGLIVLRRAGRRTSISLARINLKANFIKLLNEAGYRFANLRRRSYEQ
jgi:hypothetical protein